MSSGSCSRTSGWRWVCSTTLGQAPGASLQGQATLRLGASCLKLRLKWEAGDQVQIKLFMHFLDKDHHMLTLSMLHCRGQKAAPKMSFRVAEHQKSMLGAALYAREVVG
eukprot:4073111-Amphidinium_carterae.1